MENNYKVYIHIFPNNKKYIGITKQKYINSRWRNGKGYAKCQRIYNAIAKYGWDNIKHEILFENLTKEEAENKEIELIALYKTNQKEYGYNIANGGCHCGSMSEETRKKISESRKGQPKNSGAFKKGNIPWNKGKKNTYSQEFRKKLSESNKRIWAGKHLPEETRKKISEKKKGIRLGNALSNMKKIIQYDLEGNYINEFECMADAEKELNIKYQNISMCCRGIIHKTHGYKFGYKNQGQ